MTYEHTEQGIETMTKRVGQISDERGRRAVENQEAGWSRLFRCALVECVACGATDHAPSGRPNLSCRCGARLSSAAASKLREWRTVHLGSRDRNYGSMVAIETHWHLGP